MDSNFLIKINNLNELKANSIKITDNNIYCYWCNKNELEKICLGVELNYSHLSFFFSSKSDKVDELVNGIILIFLKNPKILYGIIKVESLIIKNLIKNSYLEEDNTDYNNELLNNESIIVNENLFSELVKKYKIVEVPKMIFVKFKHLYEFTYEISIKKFNEYISSQSEFKYPRCIQNKEMIKCWDKKFILNISNYIEQLNIQNKNISSANDPDSDHDPDSDSNLNSDLNSDLNKNIKSQKFCIPVLWNSCDDIKNKLNELKTNHKQKKFFISHYTNCTNCEINDNNDKFLTFVNKDITIKYINENSDIKIFDLMVNKYKNIDKLTITEEYNTLKFKKGKINIVCCPKSKTIYNNCLFIIE